MLASHPESASAGPAPKVADPVLQPWEVALDLRWKVAREVLLDPIAWLGTLAAGWAIGRLGGLSAGSGLLLLLGGATLLADRLLFASRENELLRTQPLGPTGLLQVRRRELSWLLHPLRVVLLLAVAGRDGWLVGAATWAAAGFLPGMAQRLAIALRRRYGTHGAAAMLLPALLGLFQPIPGGWETALAIGAFAAFLGRGVSSAAHFEQLASAAQTASPRKRGRGWRLLETVLPLPAPLRSRLTRDLVLLVSGRDLRGATLLVLAPLSCLLLRDELNSLASPSLLEWRTLTSAALGGAALAYAVGPGIHLLRNEVMAWERTAPHPGSRALSSALVYALGFVLLHGAAILATVALVDQGRFAGEVPSLIVPVLGLEAAMAHYVVVFTMGASTGRRILGEGTLVLALPVVAIGVAIAVWFSPWLALVYFVFTTGLVAKGIQRYERVEVHW
ncbi:MAG: hypothetical protein VX498_14500 [Myxococcota bacterium]|nr:hypothetical protein [Myxococcota bacterium]